METSENGKSYQTACKNTSGHSYKLIFNHELQRIVVEESLNDDDEAQFLPDTVDESGETHMSPALRALMAK